MRGEEGAAEQGKAGSREGRFQRTDWSSASRSNEVLEEGNEEGRDPPALVKVEDLSGSKDTADSPPDAPNWAPRPHRSYSTLQGPTSASADLLALCPILYPCTADL